MFWAIILSACGDPAAVDTDAATDDDTDDSDAGDTDGGDTDGGDTDGDGDDTDVADTDEPPVACTDLDCDGWPDLVFARPYAGLSPELFWGSADGFVADAGTPFGVIEHTKAVLLEDLDRDGVLDLVFTRFLPAGAGAFSTVLHTTSLRPLTFDRTDLPADASHGVAAADLDKDGFVDLVITNQGNYRGSFLKSASIFWGDKAGYSADRLTSLPTIGGFGVSIDDVDGDSWPDVLISNYFDGTNHRQDSYLYLGSPDGFSEARRLAFPTLGARGNLIADINQDGWKDLLFCNFNDDSTWAVNSYVYWGSATGFSLDDRLDLPTVGAHTATASDLDRDGFIDLVFTGQRMDADWTGTPDSLIYWGSRAGWGDDLTRLHTERASGQVVSDLDGDGDLDVLMGNFGDQTDAGTKAYLFWNEGDRFSGTPTLLPTGATDGVAAGPGEQGF